MVPRPLAEGSRAFDIADETVYAQNQEGNHWLGAGLLTEVNEGLISPPGYSDWRNGPDVRSPEVLGLQVVPAILCTGWTFAVLIWVLAA